MNYPWLVFIITLVGLAFSAYLGTYLVKRHPPLSQDERDDLGVIVAASLTLLGLIIGFTFSMAVTRYDQRKNYEEEEANAIGTEYLRVDLLASVDAPKIHQTLREYLDQRIAFYQARDNASRASINSTTSRLQAELWTSIESSARANPTPVAALTAAGMNDVLNRQGYTQAAWWNRIPIAAWALMFAIAIACNLLIGYTSHRSDIKARRYIVLPIIVAISFLLIADIDSPAGGIIRIRPQNLEALAQSLHP